MTKPNPQRTAQVIDDKLPYTGDKKSTIGLHRAQARVSLVPQENALTIARHRLVLKSLKEALSSSDLKQLRYIDWQLDQIEDAQNGERLDALEAIAKNQLLLAEQIEIFSKTLLEKQPTILAKRRRR